MSHPDPGQPDLTALRAVAEGAEFTQAEAALNGTYGYRLAGADSLAPLARDLVRSLTEAGLTVHHCARHDPLYRLGGVCLLPIPTGQGTGPSGIAVSWTGHNLLLLDWDRYGTYAGTQEAMNAALGSVLVAFGYPVIPFGPGSAWLVTGRRAHEMEQDGDRSCVRAGRQDRLSIHRGCG
jgi:hypothetical protein